MANIAVIGAGIAGLSAAYSLKRSGHTPVVFESSDYAGGRVKSFARDGFTYDVGAFIYLGSYTETIELIEQLGLHELLGKFDAYGAMPRDGKLNYLNLKTPIRTILETKYLSAGSKLKMLRLLAFLFMHWNDLNYSDATGIAGIDTETVESYCLRYLNQEIYDYVAAVVVRGPWLADPAEASVGQLLWTLKNFFKPYFYGLEGGMAVLPEALAAQLDVRLATPVSIVADLATHVEVTFKAGGMEQTQQFERCVMTTTADRALALYPQMRGVERSFYETTTYITSVNTHLALRRRPENPATYIMVSPRENIDLCGVIVDHLKAAKRVPDGKGMMTVFCRDAWCVANFEVSNERILEQILQFLHPYYGDLSATLEDYEIGRWAQVVPMMPKGRFKEVAAYQKSIDPASRVQMAGDLVPVGGVNAALVSGRAAADRILTQYAWTSNSGSQ